MDGLQQAFPREKPKLPLVSCASAAGAVLSADACHTPRRITEITVKMSSFFKLLILNQPPRYVGQTLPNQSC